MLYALLITPKAKDHSRDYEPNVHHVRLKKLAINYFNPNCASHYYFLVT